ncbi:MAG TPA: hypothetical protein VFE62_25125 [Gemmataceae bacterium]|nr:hypothetical protein [Gemmataceae bacterium]
MTLDQELAKNIQAYSKMSEDQLLAELGRRLETLPDESTKKMSLSVADAAMPLPTAVLAGPIAERLKAIALRFLKRFNNDLYRLMCDPNDPDNKKIREAASQGEQAITVLLGSLLLSYFAWLPGIIAIVAGLIIKRFVKSLADAAYNGVCASWGKELGLVGS